MDFVLHIIYNMIRRIIFSVVISIAAFAVFAQSVQRPEASVLASGSWYAISVPSDGIYKLTKADFVSLGVEESEINFDNLSIFGQCGGAISETNSDYTHSDLLEKAIYVNKQGNPYVLFYCEGTTKTTYNAENETFSFSIHPYSDVATYFVTFSPEVGTKKRISEREVVGTEPASTVSSVQDFFLHKRELANLLSSGRNWVGEPFSMLSNEVSIPLSLQNINPEHPTKITLCVLNQSESQSTVNVSVNGSPLGTITMNATPSDYAASRMTKFFSTTLSSPSATVKMTFSGAGTAKGRLEYVKADFVKRLSYNNSSLSFFTSENLTGGGAVRYNIDNVKTNAFQIWEIENGQPALVSDYTKNGETVSLVVQSPKLKKVIIFSGSNFPTPTLKGRVENQNLHGWEAADFVIVSAPQFLEQAERLAELHRQYDGISVKVATTQQVYNEFSSGTKDFLAIRELMRMLYERYGAQGRAPKNLLLFGDGTFDNKNILKYNNNFIPTFQSENSLIDAGSSFTTDDVLAYLSPYATANIRDTMLIGVGRFTVNTAAEAKNMVDKCERYISKADLKNGEWGDWRNTVTLTADDADTWGERYFIENAENIYYEIKQTSPTLNVEKIYSDAYKQYASSSGATYPDASKAINQRMKKGCLLFNYVGHGSDNHLSSERLITITDITGWTNKNALPIFITSTCEFTRFDQADKQSAGEFVLSSTDGGGIALISASRKIPSRNEINRNLHRYAVLRENGKGLTFGEVFMRAKNATTLVVEERSFGLFGDPALRICLPEYEVRTTRINDNTLENPDAPDTVRALSTLRLEGEIVDSEGARVNSFNGKIQITILDKASNYRTLDNEGLNTDIEFEQQKNVLHKGVAEVRDGAFSYTLTLPKDIAYNYGYGKISYYAQSSETDATGYFTNFIVGGIDTSVEIAETRPEIKLYINDTNFRSGGITDEHPELFALISDSVAINTVGTGLGHDIIARLDNAANTFVLNDYFETDGEGFNSGSIRFPLSDLTEGEHTLSLKVWNIFNFSSEAEIKFTVCSSKDEEVLRLKNYPNPFSETTEIVLEHNLRDEITEATLEIFSPSGKLVLETDLTPWVSAYTVGPINWDGTTLGGEKLTSGVYFARMHLSTTGGERNTKTHKIVIFGRDK